MRCFIAIPCSEPIRLKVEELMASLQHGLSKEAIRWVKPEGLHLTLRFLGEVNSKQLPDLESALQDAFSVINEFQLAFTGLGFFGKLPAPRVLWLGIQAPEELRRLAKTAERASAPFTMEPESNFKAHITLARIGARLAPETVEKLSRHLEEARDQHLGAQYVSSVALLQSTLTPQGAIYKSIANFSLRKKYVRLCREVKTGST